MLRRLTLENFKSWKKADLEFGKITGLFGTNSSGKSSLIQFLLLLKQTREATDRNTVLELNGPYVELGTPESITPGQQSGLNAFWILSYEHEFDKTIRFRFEKSQQASFKIKGHLMDVSCSVSLGGTARGMHVNRFQYQIGQAAFGLYLANAKEMLYQLSASGIEVNGQKFVFNKLPGITLPQTGPSRAYVFPDSIRSMYTNSEFLSDFEVGYEKQFDRVHYLGPLRDSPKRNYLWSRSKPTDVGPRGERTIDAIMSATVAGELRSLTGKKKKLPFQNIIGYWLHSLGLTEDFRIHELVTGSNLLEVKLAISETSPEVLLPEVGFGVSQVLPVITLLEYVPQGSTVILEQPELHLHPLAQAELADVIIHAAMHRNVQVILESHSEHLLLRLQRRIAAQEGITADDVRLYFTRMEEGESKLDRLELDTYGNIQNWPDKFFGDAFEETFQAQEARLKRMQQDRQG